MNRFVRFYRCRLKARSKAEILFWRSLLTLFTPDLLALALPDVLLNRIYIYILINVDRHGRCSREQNFLEFVFANITLLTSFEGRLTCDIMINVLFVLCKQVISEIK